MPATTDTAEYLEALSSAAAQRRIQRFISRYRLESALSQRVLPILGLSDISYASPEMLPVVIHMLQVSSLYPDPLDAILLKYA